jgi:hypothetical protein
MHHEVSAWDVCATACSGSAAPEQAINIHPMAPATQIRMIFCVRGS